MGSSRITQLASIVAATSLVTALLTAAGGAAGAGEEKRGNVNGALELGQLAAQTGQLSNIVQSLTVPVTMARAVRPRPRLTVGRAAMSPAESPWSPPRPNR